MSLLEYTDVGALLAARTCFYVVLIGHVLHYRQKFKGGRFERFVLLPCFNTVYGVLSLIGTVFKFLGRAVQNDADSTPSSDSAKEKGTFNKYSSYDDALAENQRYIGWIHGAVVFLSLWCMCSSEGDNIDHADTPLRYMVGSVVVYFIWDGGAIHSDSYWFTFCLNLHHLGCVVALLYQGTDSSRDWQNTCFYSHLWLIHSFGFVQDIILPLIGIKKFKDGQKSTCMEVVRYVYALRSAHLFYRYLHVPGQPGIGWNHQSVAMLAMLAGRLLAGNNFKQIDFIRRVEVPGYVFAVISYLFWKDSLTSSALATILLYGVVILCLVLIPRTPKPDKLILNEEVRQFLTEKWDQRDEVFVVPKSDKVEPVQKWWKSKPEFAEKWPLHDAVIQGDAGKVREIMAQQQAKEQPACPTPLRQRKHGDGSDTPTKSSESEEKATVPSQNILPDASMTDWYECTPLHFACHIGFADVVLELLHHGANPWKSIMIGDATKLAANQGHKELLSFFDELAILVFKALDVDEKALQEMRNPPLRNKLAEIL